MNIAARAVEVCRQKRETMAQEEKIMFCSGGCRSGKSRFAINWANYQPRHKVFLATTEVRDAEMAARVQRHQQERGEQWETLELPFSLALELPYFVGETVVPSSCLIIDCLSNWVAACQELLSGAGQTDENIDLTIAAVLDNALDRLAQADVRVAMVSAEVGMGLIPETSEGRLYRDILGRVNQLAAAKADGAYFLVSGIALKIK